MTATQFINDKRTSRRFSGRYNGCFREKPLVRVFFVCLQRALIFAEVLGTSLRTMMPSELNPAWRPFCRIRRANFGIRQTTHFWPKVHSKPEPTAKSSSRRRGRAAFCEEGADFVFSFLFTEIYFKLLIFFVLFLTEDLLLEVIG